MHEGHRERLKAQFKNNKYTVDGWQEHNVLELLLFYAIPRVDTNEIAHRLLDKFGSISGVMDASPKALSSVEGIGENAAVFIKLLPQIFSRYLSQKQSSDESFTDMSAKENREAFLIPMFFGASEESFLVMCLDNKNRLICCDKLFSGTVNTSQINIRLIVEYAIRNSASSIIIAHNHPKGIPQPSYNDILVTKQLMDVLYPMNIRLVDHIIIADSNTYSMREMKDF